MSTPIESLPLHMRRDGFDPPAELAALREAGGLRRVTTPLGLSAWLVTRYGDVREVLGDAERFSNSSFVPSGSEHVDPDRLAERRAGSLLLADPPEHTRLRRMLTGEFTVRRIRRLEPRIEEIVTDHLDAMAAAGAPADLVPSFALPVPSLVICELLGVPYADRDEFQGRTTRQIDLSRSLDDRLAAAEESRAYMGELVDRARAEPGDDMLGMLVREHGEELSRAELAGVANLLLIAGHETTANMLALGTLALLRAPEQRDRVRDEDDAVAPAVEELLRYLSIVHSGVPRVARVDTTIGGQEIAAGEVLVTALPTANRDADAVPHAGSAGRCPADRLDVTRDPSPHLAFGHGIHHCLGAPLARREMIVAFPALLRRFPGLALADPGTEPRFRSASVVYGLRSLPVTW